MTAIPKPARRAKVPWAHKRGRRPRRQRKSTPAQLARDADRLWSRMVRAKGSCEFLAGLYGPSTTPLLCSGALQAAHGISRRYRHTRWLLINGFALCQKHHMFWTHRPVEFEAWLRRAWGDSVYNDLQLIALRAFKPDVGAALEALKDEAKARGIE